MIPSENKRILLIDLLRVLAIALILYSHIIITLGPSFSRWGQLSFGIGALSWSMTWGAVGVTIFLITSGLSLELSYGSKKVKFGAFYAKRIVRIYPVYYMSLLVAIFVQGAFGVWAYAYHGKSVTLLPAFDLGAVLLTLTGLNAAAGRWGGTLVWSSWFISLIMMLYLLYPLISYGMKKRPWRFLALLGVICVTARIVTVRSNLLGGDPLEWFPLNRIFEFGLGVFLARVIAEDALLRWNKPLMRFPYLTYFSALSFPLFLIHDPLRKLINLGGNSAHSAAIGVPVFLIFSLLLSAFALILDKKIKEWLTERAGSGDFRSTYGPFEHLA